MWILVSVSGQRTLWPSGTWPLITDRMSCRWIPVVWLSPRPMTSHRMNPSGCSSLRLWILKDCNCTWRRNSEQKPDEWAAWASLVLLWYLLGAARGGAAHHCTVDDPPTERWLDWTDEAGLPGANWAQEENPGLRDISTFGSKGGDDFHQAFLLSGTRVWD